MKKTEVQIGGVYVAKVSGNQTYIRIDGESRHGGWDATNLKTKKRVRIATARRLRKVLTDGPADGPQVTEGDIQTAIDSGSTPRVEEPAPEAAVDVGEAPTPRPTRRTRMPKPAGEASRKRLSALSAAAQVLEQEGRPMKTREMIEAMAARGLWTSPGGKTPEATLYAAILREIGAKGPAARFRKADRGMFESNSVGGPPA